MARAWEVRAGRYRDIAKAFLEGREYLARRIARSVAEDPPRNADQVWLNRDRRVANGQAWPVDIQRWSEEARAIAREASARVVAARRRTWVDWANEAWAKKLGKFYAWCKGERGPSIVATKPEGHGWLTDPASVIDHATDCWAALWKPEDEAQEPVGHCFDELPGMPPPCKGSSSTRLQPTSTWARREALTGGDRGSFGPCPRRLTYIPGLSGSPHHGGNRRSGRGDLKARWSRSSPRKGTTGAWPRGPLASCP